jgi:hypothetical protein
LTKQQQQSKPPAIMVQRFCSKAADILSSHAQVTFMPPGHLAKAIVQRGTIVMFMPEEVGAWAPAIPVEPVIGMPIVTIPEHSISLAEVIFVSLINRRQIVSEGNMICHQGKI